MNQSYNEEISYNIHSLDIISQETEKLLENCNLIQQQSFAAQQQLTQQFISEFNPENQQALKDDPLLNKIYKTLQEQQQNNVQEQIQSKLFQKVRVSSESYRQLQEITFDLQGLSLNDNKKPDSNPVLNQQQSNNSTDFFQYDESLCSSYYDQDSISFLKQNSRQISHNNHKFLDNIKASQSIQTQSQNNLNSGCINSQNNAQYQQINANDSLILDSEKDIYHQQQTQQPGNQQLQKDILPDSNVDSSGIQQISHDIINKLSEIKEYENEDHSARITKQIDFSQTKPNNQILNNNLSNRHDNISKNNDKQMLDQQKLSILDRDLTPKTKQKNQNNLSANQVNQPQQYQLFKKSNSIFQYQENSQPFENSQLLQKIPSVQNQQNQNSMKIKKSKSLYINEQTQQSQQLQEDQQNQQQNGKNQQLQQLQKQQQQQDISPLEYDQEDQDIILQDGLVIGSIIENGAQQKQEEEIPLYMQLDGQELLDDSSSEKQKQPQQQFEQKYSQQNSDILPKQTQSSKRSSSQLLTPQFDNKNQIENNSNIIERKILGEISQKQCEDRQIQQDINQKDIYDINQNGTESSDNELDDWEENGQSFQHNINNNIQLFKSNNTQQQQQIFKTNNNNSNNIFNIKNNNLNSNINGQQYQQSSNYNIYDDVLMEGFEDWKDINELEDCNYEISQCGSNSDCSYDKSFRQLTVVDKQAYIEFVQNKRCLTQELQVNKYDDQDNEDYQEDFRKENSENLCNFNGGGNSLNLFSQDNNNNINNRNNNFKSNKSQNLSINFNNFREVMGQSQFFSQSQKQNSVFSGIFHEEGRHYKKMDFKKLQKNIDPNFHHGFTTPPPEQELEQEVKPLKKQVKKLFIRGKMVPNFAEDLKKLEKECTIQQQQIDPYQIFGKQVQRSLKLQPIFQLDDSEVDKCRGSSADWRKYSCMKSIKRCSSVDGEEEEEREPLTPLKGLLGSISKHISGMKNIFKKQQ